MRTYKDFKKEYIGSSDIASLIFGLLNLLMNILLSYELH